jgi:hypothetical protein
VPCSAPKSFGLFALGNASQATIGWYYRTPDGAEHYFANASEVPAAYRDVAQPVSIEETSFEPDVAGAHETAVQGTVAAPEPTVSLQPEAPFLVIGALLCAGVSVVLHRSLRQRGPYSNDRLRVAARVSIWLTAIATSLALFGFAQPHFEQWSKRLDHYRFDSLVSEEERNSDVMRDNIAKTQLDALGVGAPDAKRGPPAAPAGQFWIRPPPPPGLLHH